MDKPRLAENESDLWKAVYEQFHYWWNLQYYIEIDTLGEGVYSLDRDKKIIRIYSGRIPTYSIPNNRELAAIDKSFKDDTVQITAKKMGKSKFSGDSFPDYLLHSCSGMGFKSKEEFIKHEL